MTSSSPGILSVSREVLLDRNVRVIAITGLISGVYIGMLNTILQPFTVSLGVSLAGLGVLQALGGRFSGLTASLVQPFAGHYADVFGRKLVVIVGSIVTLGSMALFFLAALTLNWLILAAAYLLFGLSMLGSPASQAIIAESVDLDPTKMGIAFSTVFLLSSITSTVTSLAGGVLADVLGYYLIFVIAILFESVDLLLYLKELRETGPSRDASGSAQGGGFSLRDAASLPKGFLGFFAAFAMDSFAFGITASIIVGMIYDRFRYSNTEIGLIVGVISLATIVAQYPATRLLLLVGPKRSLAISEFFGALLMLGWYFADTIPVFILLSVVFGVSVATWVPAQQSITMTASPPKERGSLGGKLAAFRGLVAFPAPILGGVLYEVYGYRAPSLVSFVFIVLTLIMILKYLPEREAKP
jgi:DHA1 family multidrug resistance protein-like MFS transporter